MVNAIECSAHEWNLLKNSFRDAKLEIAHRCGYAGNMLPDGLNDDWLSLDQYGFVPNVGQDGVSMYDTNDQECGYANYVNGELRVDGVFENCRSVRDVVQTMNGQCLCKENLESLEAGVRRFPETTLFPRVDMIKDACTGITHVIFDKENFALESFLSRQDGTLVMHDVYDTNFEDVRKEVYDSLEASVSEHGRLDQAPPTWQVRYFTGKELVTGGALHEHVGNGMTVSARRGALELAVTALREEALRDCLKGTEYSKESVKDFYPEHARLPYYDAGAVSIDCNASVAEFKSWDASQKAFLKVAEAVRAPENMDKLREEVTSAFKLRQEQSRSSSRKA